MADNEAFSIDAFRLGAGYSRPEIAYTAHVTPPIGSRLIHFGRKALSLFRTSLS